MCIPVLLGVSDKAVLSSGLLLLFLQGSDGGTRSQKHIGHGNDVVDEAQNDPNDMAKFSVSNPNNLE
jgi:hypothetical protein